MRTNMPLYFEQDIYCLAIGQHDSALVREGIKWNGLESSGYSHCNAPSSALYHLSLSQSTLPLSRFLLPFSLSTEPVASPVLRLHARQGGAAVRAPKRD